VSLFRSRSRRQKEMSQQRHLPLNDDKHELGEKRKVQIRTDNDNRHMYGK
jgi:hypothetical protein